MIRYIISSAERYKAHPVYVAMNDILVVHYIDMSERVGMSQKRDVALTMTKSSSQLLDLLTESVAFNE
jgi:hypothetical protein